MKRQGYLQPWGVWGRGNGQKGSESPPNLLHVSPLGTPAPSLYAGWGWHRTDSQGHIHGRSQPQAPGPGQTPGRGEADGPTWGVSFPSLPGAMDGGLLARCLGRCPKSSQLTGEKSDGFLIFILLVS